MPYKPKRGRPKKSGKLDDLESLIESFLEHLRTRNTEDPQWWFEFFMFMENIEEWKGDLNHGT
jgi:hypothetical protein